METEKQVTPKRNYGIDLLKITSMFMVIVLHIISYGASYGTITEGSKYYYFFGILRIAVYCCVNCFAMVSGYLMIDKKFSFSRIISIWCQIVFFSVMIYVAELCFGYATFSIKSMIRTVLPITFSSGGVGWWYVRAYFCLLFFMPFINKMINSLSKRQTAVLIAFFVILFSLVTTASTDDPFNLERGLSFLWLAVMYSFGAILQKNMSLFKFVKNKWIYIIIYLVCIVATFLLNKIYDRFTMYASPTMIVMAISLFLFFSQVKIPKKIHKAVSLVTKLSFAAYLLHNFDPFRQYTIQNRFVFLLNYNMILSFCIVLICAVIIFAAGAIVEYIRLKLFSICRLDKLIQKIANKIDNLVKFE